jgi:BirA family biotin operon repressor/biotin-[acetyl-CoA-carboxylase] ligase
MAPEPAPPAQQSAVAVRETGAGLGAAEAPWFTHPARLEVVDSTNRYLAERAVEGGPEGLSVVAERQSAGRGRLGRSWFDVPGGSVLCSMLFRPDMEIDRWFLVSMLVALAGLDACAEVAGVHARCKWPNDLVVDGRKVGGILAEVVPPPAAAAAVGGPALVVGIGLNCNWGDAWDARPLGPSVLATSLDRVAGRQVDREAVASRMLERVAQRYTALTGRTGSASEAPAPGAGRRRGAQQDSTAVPADAGALPAAALSPPAELRAAERSLTAEYRRKLDTLGRVVRVELADEVFSGRALDVDDGGLLLVDVGMCMRAVAAGDVVHLR